MKLLGRIVRIQRVEAYAAILCMCMVCVLGTRASCAKWMIRSACRLEADLYGPKEPSISLGPDPTTGIRDTFERNMCWPIVNYRDYMLSLIHI